MLQGHAGTCSPRRARIMLRLWLLGPKSGSKPTEIRGAAAAHGPEVGGGGSGNSRSPNVGARLGKEPSMECSTEERSVALGSLLLLVGGFGSS